MRALTLRSVAVLLSVSACDQGPESAGPSSRSIAQTTVIAQTRALRLVPEWDSVTAVVVQLGRAVDSSIFTHVMGPGARLLINERISFYSSIASVSSEVELIMFVDKPEHVASATSALGDPDNLSVVSRPSWAWLRDFVPLSATLGEGGRALISYTPFMRDVSQAIADQVGLPLLMGAGDAAPAIEGGNILVDGKGRCYVAVDYTNGQLEAESAAKASKLRDMCTVVRTVPRMSYETTGHIDMFTRLLNDTTVAVALYSTEDFYLAAEPVEHSLRCSDEQIRVADWKKCESVRVVYPDMGRLRQVPADSGVPMVLGASEIIDRLRDLYPGEDLEIVVRRPQSGRREHLRRVAEIFTEYGFRVLRIESPTPYVSLERDTYRDSEERVVRNVLKVDLVFPSYTNALMVNRVVYVPQYETASDSLNERARAQYEDAGFEVVPTDMTQSISFHGATRCLATGIHGI